MAEYLKDRAFARRGKPACGFGVVERRHNHEIGTSVWVPAYRGNSVGTREKKQKAD